ncbi:MAG: hypothetical protein WCI97_08150, partial [Bacteroidota bacterium]
TETVSDLLEVLLLQKETGLLQGCVNEQALADLIVVPPKSMPMAFAELLMRCGKIRALTVRRGATIGAGATITKEAPADQLTLSRAKQMSVPVWQRPVKKT